MKTWVPTRTFDKDTLVRPDITDVEVLTLKCSKRPVAVWTIIPTREISTTRPEIGTLFEIAVTVGVGVDDVVVPGDATTEGVDVVT